MDGVEPDHRPGRRRALPYTSRPNGGTTPGEYTDGLRTTVAFAEVETYTWTRVSNAGRAGRHSPAGRARPARPT